MAKNVCTNKSLIKAEVNHYLELLRNAIAFNGRDYVPVYFAGVHQEALAEIQAMGIKVEPKAGRWTTKFYAPKKGSKAWEALFKGSKVLDDAKAIADAKVKAAAAAAKEKAEKKAAKEKAKAEKEKAAAKAAKERRRPRLRRPRLRQRLKRKRPLLRLLRRRPRLLRLRLRPRLLSPRRTLPLR